MGIDSDLEFNWVYELESDFIESQGCSFPLLSSIRKDLFWITSSVDVVLAGTGNVFF